MEGIQILVDLIDGDGSLNHDLVDRFVVNVASLESTNEFHVGIFGLAEFNITTEVTCTLEFPDCELNPTSSPTTLPLLPTTDTTDTITTTISLFQATPKMRNSLAAGGSFFWRYWLF